MTTMCVSKSKGFPLIILISFSVSILITHTCSAFDFIIIVHPIDLLRIQQKFNNSIPSKQSISFL